LRGRQFVILPVVTVLAGTLLLLVRFGGQPPSVVHPATLAGTTWRLLTAQGRPVPAGPDLTLEFDGDGVEGNGGCNGFGGQFTYEPATGAISVSRRVSTLRECFDQARIDLEAAYLNALAGATIASMDSDGHLVLSGPATELVFEVGPRQVGVPIEGSPDGSIAP
jgi:heat shock protein HslJ